MVRFVLKPGSFCLEMCPESGPFCPEMWSILSQDVVRFVLKRGPFCPSTAPFDMINMTMTCRDILHTTCIATSTLILVLPRA